ncbi:MAG: co-chaperone GroES [Fimbriimonadaceae bacterium]|nr:co-chaperone GroES [Fimbriimonadaceae bacterium]
MAGIGLRPLEDRVIVKVNEEQETLEGGIVLPESAQKKPQDGTVVAVGPGKLDDAGERIAVDVKVGDTVIFTKYGGTTVKVGDEELLILRADDILAVRA